MQNYVEDTGNPTKIMYTPASYTKPARSEHLAARYH